MISKELVDAVHIEAAKLKENATKDELAHLDFDQLNPTSFYYCIYGQAVGDCRNARAVKLICKCAPLIVSIDDSLETLCSLPRSTKKSFIAERGDHRARWRFSPIESYIVQKGADNAQLIRYLKGQRKTLNLSKTINC